MVERMARPRVFRSETTKAEGTVTLKDLLSGETTD